MIVEDLEQVIEEAKALPPEEQKRLAAAIRIILHQPPIASREIQPAAMAAFEQVMQNSTNVLDYLKDK